MLHTGDSAPGFDLSNQSGEQVSLDALLRRGPLVLYFYPADFTPGCTREACAFAALDPELQRHGLTIAGISPQNPDSHTRFRSQHGLPFTLLSDPVKEVIRLYGADGPLGFGVRRISYFIDTRRRIRAALRADFRIGAHERFVRRAMVLADSLR
ncbi:MAG: peroxiredoxin [Steroidobacteraceae bacterium]